MEDKMNKILFALLTISAVLSAQFKEKDDFDPRQPLMNNNIGGIIDMNKVSIDQSYSMSYASGGNNSMMTGQYIAGLNYQLASPLMLRLELAASFIPYSSFSLPTDQKSQFYFKSASLDYRPNDKFRIKIDINHNPNGAAGWNDYQDRFGMFSSSFFRDELSNP